VQRDECRPKDVRLERAADYGGLGGGGSPEYTGYKADLVTNVCFLSIRYGDEEARKYDMGEENQYTRWLSVIRVILERILKRRRTEKDKREAAFAAGAGLEES
jgi:hypothetical protein